MRPDAKRAILAAGTGDPALTDYALLSEPLRSRASEILTARECDILALIGEGFCNKSVARMLKISPETVKSHVKHIFLKLGVSTRAAAVSRAVLLSGCPQEEANGISEGLGRSSVWVDFYLQRNDRS
jgi:DNA-binding CsgD family transcriptional regulator